jgi:RHS repeat-associated protein
MGGVGFFLICLIWFFSNPAFADSSSPVPGTIDGNADVNLTGSATYTIPIQVPPGTAGTAPKIALVYDSQAPAGVMGAGWAVSGLSKITRGLKTLRTDGIVQGPNFDDADALYLDGQRLIPVPAGSLPCGSGAGFIKEVDDQTCIEMIGKGYVAHTKAGLTMQYGMTNDSKITLQNASLILLWVCNQIQDSSGNYINLTYSAPNSSGDYNIDRIDYTGNTKAGLSPYAYVAFTYNNKAAPRDTWIAGNDIHSTSRLDRIATSVNGAKVLTYSLNYLDETCATSLQLCSPNRFLLDSVTLSDTDGLPYTSTTFNYKHPPKTSDPLWNSDPSGYGKFSGFSLNVSDYVPNGFKFIPIQLNGAVRLHSFYAAFASGKVEQASFRNAPASGTAPAGFVNWPNALPGAAVFSDNGSGTADNLNAIAVDLDGNAAAPYLIVPYNNAGVYSIHTLKFDQSKYWNNDVSIAYPLGNTSIDQKHVPHILTGNLFGHANGAVDILWDNGTTRGALRNTGSGLVTMDGFTPPFPLDASAHLLDVDCSGKASLVYFGSGKMDVYQVDVGGWKHLPSDSIFVPKIPPSLPAAAIRDYPGFNQSGSIRCKGLLIADQVSNTQEAFTSDNMVGWQLDPNHAPKFFFDDASGNDFQAVITQVPNQRVEVVANWQPGSGSPIGFASLLTSAGIDNSTSYLIPPSPIAGASVGIRGFLGDLDSDGWLDVIYYGPPIGVQLYDPNSQVWNTDSFFNPGVPFAAKGQLDSGVRFVDLQGSGRKDIIYASSSGQGAYTNSGKGWETANLLNPPNSIVFSSSTLNLSNAVQFVDVNGDGYIDLVYSSSTGGQADSKDGVYLNTAVDKTDVTKGRAWPPKPDPNFKLPDQLFFNDTVAGDLGVRFVDLRGSGRPDIIYSRMEKDNTGKIQVVTGAFLNTGSGWQASDDYKPPSQVPFVVMPGVANNPSTYSAETDVQLVDVTGSGLPDLVFNFADPQNPSNRIKGVCLNTGKGWPKNFSDCTTIDVPVELDAIERDPSLSIQYVSLMGNGLTDIVVSQAGGRGKTCTYIGTGVDPTKGGSAWQQCNPSSPNAWTVPADAISSANGDPGYRVLDVNGAGYPDIVYNWQGHTGIYINTGAGWIKGPAAWAFPSAAPFALSDGSDSGVRVLDVNGDGLPDVLLSYDNGGTRTNGVWLNAGRRSDVLCQVTDGLGVNTKIWYGTIVETAPASSCDNSNLSAREDKEKSLLQRGIGPLYMPLDVATYPIIRGTPTSYVVRSMSVDDGHPKPLTFSYQYGGLKFDALSRRSLGFAWRTSFDEQRKLLTEMHLKQADGGTIWTTGLTYRETNCLNLTKKGLCDQKPLSDEITSWKTNLRSVIWSPNVAYTVADILQTDTVTQKFDIDGSDFGWEKNHFDYDDHLNVLQSSSTRSDGTSVTIKNTYDDIASSAHWFLGRLIASTVVKVGDAGSKPEERSACFEYDQETGLLNEQIVDYGDVDQVINLYNHDEFGNIKSKQQLAYVTSSKAGGSPHCPASKYPKAAPRARIEKVTTRSFDLKGRFVESETNPEKLTTTTTHFDDFGTPNVITEPDSTVTRNTYDGFGRLATRVDAAGLTTEIRFEWPSFLDTTLIGSDASATVNCDAGVVTPLKAALLMVSTTKTSTNQLPDKYKVLDYRGREVREISYGFDLKPIFRDRYYDNYGNTVAETRPYFLNTQPAFEKSCFDALNRLTRITEPSGEIVNRTYSGRYTVIDHLFSKDKPSARTTILTNDRNAPKCVVDPNGGRTDYEYDAGDRIATISGPSVGSDGEGTTCEKPRVGGDRPLVTHIYNKVGHLQETTDPDMGTWFYQYDPFGNLLKQTDAKKQVTTLTYDLLGRVKTRSSRDNQDNEKRKDVWIYDKNAYGKGHLTSITSTSIGTSDYIEEYFYDSAGRNYRKKNTIEGEALTSISNYDSYSRIQSLEYPYGLTIDYSYDSAGLLTGITDNKSGKRYWSANDIDETGRVTEEKFGNGVTTTRAYDSQSGYAKAIRTEFGSSVLQDTSLSYDLAGDLEERKDDATHADDLFYYDPFQQLTSMKGTDGYERYDYDAAGRFRAKGGRSGYEYGDGTKGHPFHSPNVFVDKGSKQFLNYDANGNLKSRDDLNGPRRLVYTVDNRVSRIEEPGDVFGPPHWSDFEYSARGNRIRQTEHKSNSTVSETIYAGLFERISSPDVFRRYTSVTERYYLVNQGGVIAVIERNRNVGPLALPIAGRTAALAAPHPLYLEKDQLGSIVGITDESGALVAAYAYDPWGVRSALLTTRGPNPQANWTKGYTGHEQLPFGNLIHMGGRVYDADLGLFSSPDLVSQSLTDDRTINRYSYVLNNPLKFTDPNGYGWFSNAVSGLGNALSSAGQALGNALSDAAHAAGSWLQDNWREVVVIGVAIGVTILTAGATSPILAGMIVGVSVAATSSALYGGSISDVLKAAAEGAVFGAIGGSIAEVFTAGGWESVLAQGGLKGLETTEAGGNFAQGFGVGALSALEPDVQDIAGFSGAALIQIGAQAALNGTISAVEGEKFANGALWGAYLQLQIDSNAYQWSEGIQSTALAGLVNATQSLVRDATDLITTINAFPTTVNGIVAAATIVTFASVDANAGPYELQASIVTAGAIQQMYTDPSMAGSVMFSSNVVVGLRPVWIDEPANSSGANYMATYGYGFSAVGPFSYGDLWRTQSSGGSWLFSQ